MLEENGLLLSEYEVDQKRQVSVNTDYAANVKRLLKAAYCLLLELKLPSFLTKQVKAKETSEKLLFFDHAYFVYLIVDFFNISHF